MQALVSNAAARGWEIRFFGRGHYGRVKCWFGLRLPGVRMIADLDKGFPDEFFSQVVYSEPRRALDAVGATGK